MDSSILGRIVNSVEGVTQARALAGGPSDHAGDGEGGPLDHASDGPPSMLATEGAGPMLATDGAGPPQEGSPRPPTDLTDHGRTAHQRAGPRPVRCCPRAGVPLGR